MYRALVWPHSRLFGGHDWSPQSMPAATMNSNYSAISPPTLVSAAPQKSDNNSHNSNDSTNTNIEKQSATKDTAATLLDGLLEDYHESYLPPTKVKHLCLWRYIIKHPQSRMVCVLIHLWPPCDCESRQSVNTLVLLASHPVVQQCDDARSFIRCQYINIYIYIYILMR